MPLGCRAIFPDAFFAGVRLMPTTGLDNGTNELECSCLQPHAFNSSTLGPSANCNQVCHFFARDLFIRLYIKGWYAQLYFGGQ